MNHELSAVICRQQFFRMSQVVRQLWYSLCPNKQTTGVQLAAVLEAVPELSLKLPECRILWVFPQGQGS